MQISNMTVEELLNSIKFWNVCFDSSGKWEKGNGRNMFGEWLGSDEED